MFFQKQIGFAVVLVGRRKVGQVSFQVLDKTITRTESVSYMGIKIGRNQRLACQVQHLQIKAPRITAELNILVTSMECPRSSKRKLLVLAI